MIRMIYTSADFLNCQYF